MSCPLAAYPYCPNLLSIYICAVLTGFGSGNVNTVGNVIILNIWQGRDSGPYMHSLHFTFGLGAFLAPVVARPFLVTEESPSASHGEVQHPLLNHTESAVSHPDSVWTIKTLYPIISSYGLLTALACVYYFLQDRRSKLIRTNAKKNPTEDNPKQVSTPLKLITVGLLGD